MRGRDGKRRSRNVSVNNKRSNRRPEFPIDLVEEILKRLPVKHVVRCKCLSKPYYALIQNPSFINKHLHHWAGLTHKLLAVVGRTKDGRVNSLVNLLSPAPLQQVYTEFSSNDIFMFLVGSSNGLVCATLSDINETVTNYHNRGIGVFDALKNITSIVLWNPATREQRTLPSPPIGPHSHMGFGYDSTSDDYKLVMISFTTSRLHCWSLKTNCWREISIGSVILTAESYGYGYTKAHTGVSVKGKLYWLASIEEKHKVSATTIMSFDLVNESFCSEIALPDALPDWRIYSIYLMDILDFNGSLALSDCDDNCSPKFDIWVMNDCDKSWAKKMTIGPLPHIFSSTIMNINGKFLMARGTDPNLELLLYDPRSKAKTVLSTENIRTYSPRSFFESLVSPYPTSKIAKEKMAAKKNQPPRNQIIIID